MIHTRQYYAMREGLEGPPEPPFPIDQGSAERLNREGYAIYWAVNQFSGARRIENLVKVVSWFAEIDGDKALIKSKIQRSPLIPSLVVESKNGFHVYFDARGATLSSYKDIQLGLLSFFGADPNARDAARILRVPGYLHLKDPSDPYLVKVVHSCPVTFTEQAMRAYYPLTKNPPAHVKKTPVAFDEVSGSLFDKLSKLDNRKALEALSGHPSVRHEVFTFHDVGRGRLNILVNGKGSPCFIDESGRIGRGGPTIWQWLKWYGHSDREIANIIREVLGL